MEDCSKLAALNLYDILIEVMDLSGNKPSNLENLIDILNDHSTLIEIHIHRPISVNDINKIMIKRSVFQSLRTKAKQYSRARESEKTAIGYDRVRAYLDLMDLATEKKIPVLAGS